MGYTMNILGFRPVLGVVVLAIGLGCGPGSAPGAGGESGGSSSGSSPTATNPTATNPTATNPTATNPTASADTTEGPGSSTGDPTTGDPTTEGSTTGDPTTGSTSDASTGSESSSGGDMLPDISGDFLMAAATTIEPTLPLQFIATFNFTPAGMGGTVDVDLQRLALNQGSTTDPRTPFGAPLTFVGVPVAADGTFSLAVGVLDIPGETNPVVPLDAQANMVVIDGTVLDADTVCGTMDGNVVFPIMTPLIGTTFSAIRVADTSPAGLPVMFPVACP
ncbi:MAG: hypothetical protein AAGF11_32420 [Myxococcota bacterium]